MWSEVSTIATRNGRPVSLGLEAVSKVQGYADDEAGTESERAQRADIQIYMVK
jgi:hypothetical protein